MDPNLSSVRLPSTALAALAERCRRAGPEAVQALREAGRLTGVEIFGRLVEDADPENLSPADFWETVARDLADMGFGAVSYEVLTEGVAAVEVRDLPEARQDGSGGNGTGGCPFSTGLLGGLVTEAAEAPVAVLEVECRSQGDESCRFLLGSEERLSGVRSRLLEGASLSDALRPS